MGRTETHYSYFAKSTHKLFEQIGNDKSIKWIGPYDQYKKRQKLKIKNIIVPILDILTGGDIIGFINDYLTPMDIALYIHPASHIITDLITATNTFNDHKYKSNYLQFLAPHFSRKQLQSLGCICGWTAHKTATYWRSAHKEIAPFRPLFGRKSLPDAVEKNVFDFLIKNSRIAANRVSIKHQTSLRHANDNGASLYYLYEQQNPKKSHCYCSESSFNNYRRLFQIFTKPTRDSDMCPLCQNHHKLRASLQTLHSAFKRQIAAPIDCIRGNPSITPKICIRQNRTLSTLLPFLSISDIRALQTCCKDFAEFKFIRELPIKYTICSHNRCPKRLRAEYCEHASFRFVPEFYPMPSLPMDK